MMSRRLLQSVIAVVTMLVMLGPSVRFAGGQTRSGPAAPTTRPSANAPVVRPSFREHYSVISEHNIFVRERARAWRDQNASGASAGSPPQRSPEQTYVLTGIVLENGEQRAYLEDRARGGLVRLGVGDPIARGRISDIDINSITYEQAGREQWIAIGSDLTGSAPVIPSYAESSATTSPTTLPFDPNSQNLTTEQRMMLNRVKELNKK